jgi:cytochrome b involved in lipid metabolism
MKGRYFTRAQVATHNTENDCWVIMDKKVYNLTNLLDVHPGGKMVILNCAGPGRDAKETFDGQEHSKLAQLKLK